MSDERCPCCEHKLKPRWRLLITEQGWWWAKILPPRRGMLDSGLDGVKP